VTKQSEFQIFRQNAYKK